MLFSVSKFCELVQTRLEELVEELKIHTGRSGEEELLAWRYSLPKLARVLSDTELKQIHLFFPKSRSLILEYRLPASSAWCDVVLLGQNDGRPRVIMLELKHWDTWGDRPGPSEGLIIRRQAPQLHPSEQVRGYVEYCRFYHSAVQKFEASVAGSVLFTKEHQVSQAYLAPPNHRLVAEYPCFAVSQDGVVSDATAFLANSFAGSDETFAVSFAEGTYQQNRSFLSSVADQILGANEKPLVLLDKQRYAYNYARSVVEGALSRRVGSSGKQVVLIEGPPGSGKSVIAAKLWATLAKYPSLKGNVVLVTTSTSHTTNWRSIFARAGAKGAAGVRAGEGIVKPATSFVPLSTAQLGRLRKQFGRNFLASADKWRDNLRELRDLGITFQEGSRDDQYQVAIVDEAHALINPEHPSGRGQFGFAPTLGPLGYHIIRCCNTTIFLLDANQGFRDRENTTVEDLKKWAQELGAKVYAEISLADSQFRCGGSKDYVDWLDELFFGMNPERARLLAQRWRRALDFKIFRDPISMEEALRVQHKQGKSVRLLASYAREWKTQNHATPHSLPPDKQDFFMVFPHEGKRVHWSKVWNYVPQKNRDYTWFVQAPPGSALASDPLCEVGCPYAVRGFDFDCVGVLWLGDLKFRRGTWTVDLEHVHETGLGYSLGLLRRGQQSAAKQIRWSLMQAYRILLTRGIQGVYLWFEDVETRRYVESCVC